MTNSHYWTRLTSAGRQAILDAIANEQTVEISEFGVGDGHLTPLQETLTQEKYRGAINSVKLLDTGNLAEIIGVLPVGVGGFYVREAAFYMPDGRPFALVKHPETYKPSGDENAAAELKIKAVIDVENNHSVAEKIDPSLTYATREWVGDAINPHGLGTQISHQSGNFFDRTFELRLGAGESKPFPDLPDTACDILIFGLTDGTATSTNFVGRFAKYGSTWSANTIYGNTSGVNHPSIDIVENIPTFKNHHSSNSYRFSFKCWIACQDRGNAKPFEFFANTYSTYNKPTPADIGAVAKGESINLTDQDIIWSKNTDGAKIGFKNDADSDTDSYLFFETSDNANEYFKWRHRSGTSYSEWMSLNKSGISTRNATFDNGTNTTVNIQADSGGRAILNVCSQASSSQSTGTVYVGQSPSHGGGIEYNGDGSPATAGAGADFFTFFRRAYGIEHWTARNFVENNNWEFRANVKAASFEENGTLLSAKYHPKSTKLDRFERSFVDTNGVQDLKIREKRALVGTTDNLYINYSTDWQRVYAQGHWNFNGDITITKNNPWLTLQSNTSGGITNEQAAGISIGESGRSNAASLHISYTGDGLSYIGMGLLGSDNIPNNWAMQMDWTSTWVCFRSEIRFGDYKTKLSKGYSDSLRVVTPHGNFDVGPKNQDWCHFDTSNPKFYFGKPVHVKGEIYAGSNYDKRVYHEGYKPTASDVGAFQHHSDLTPEVNNTEFTTIAKVIGGNLASRCSITLKGTTSNTVINFSADILVNHHKDIVVESLSGDYTQLELKILSNGSEKYLIQVKLVGGNSLPLSCHILSHTNDNVSIGNYSSTNYPIEHIHKSKRSSRVLSSINETNMFVGEHKLFHTGNTNVRDWNIVTSTSNVVRWYKVASFYASNTNDSYRWLINLAGTKGYGAGFNSQSGGATIYVTKANDGSANNLNVVAYNHCISNTLSSLIEDLKVTSEDVSGQNTWFTVWARLGTYTGASALMSGTDCSSNSIKLHTNESQEAEPEGGFKKPIFTSIHSGNVDEYLVGERKKPLVNGVIPAHSNVHLKTSDTFTLPPVAETPEDAVIVVSKRLDATPTIVVDGISSEVILMAKQGKVVTDTQIVYDLNLTLTFILNAEKNWEMQ
ncbi:phage tail protein [Pseudoalteromonas piscicida]|uniref:phage tail protein n=1 Tax=Pseudoalteromonas piscicida TaxID=43662 RepID=UPI0030C9BBBF